MPEIATKCDECGTQMKMEVHCPNCDRMGDGSGPGSPVAGVMARVRSEEPPDEKGWYWLEEPHPVADDVFIVEMKEVFYGPPQTLVVRPGPGHGKPVEEVDGLWTGPMPKPSKISERREAP